MRHRVYYTIAVLLLCLSCANAQENPISEKGEDPRATIYHTREEKREAGLGVEITDWLKVSTLLELELTRDKYYLATGIQTAGRSKTNGTIELAFEIELSKQIGSEIILEYNSDENNVKIDEATINFDLNDYEIVAGRLYLPFGLYYSHFSTGPLLEFGETQADIILLNYDLSDAIEIAGFVFSGNARKLNGNRHSIDWGATIEMKYFDESIVLGAGYLSDLAESDQQFLKDSNNRYQQRVGAWNAYAITRRSSWEATIETLWATNAFIELGTDKDKPKSWNLELAYFIGDNWELATRFEQIDELVDEPAQQIGIAVNWRAHRNVSLGIEFLRAHYKPGFVFDDNGNELVDRNLIFGRFSLEF